MTLIDWFVKNYKKAMDIIAWFLLLLIPVVVFLYALIVFQSLGFAIFGAIISIAVVFLLEFIFIPPLMVLFSIYEKLMTKTL